MGSPGVTWRGRCAGGGGAPALAPGCTHPWVKLGSGPPPLPPVALALQLRGSSGDLLLPLTPGPSVQLPPCLHFLLEKQEQLLVLLRALLLKKQLTFDACIHSVC